MTPRRFRPLLLAQPAGARRGAGAVRRDADPRRRRRWSSARSSASSAGVVSAVRQYGWQDKVITLIVLVGISMPSFFLGLILIMVFAVDLRWLPAGGMYAIYGGGDLLDLLRHLFLPALTLAVVATGVVARLTRASMLEVLRQDYVRTARAKGLPESKRDLQARLPGGARHHHPDHRHPGRLRARRRRLHRERVPVAGHRPMLVTAISTPRHPAGPGRRAARRRHLRAGQSRGRRAADPARSEAARA